MSDRASSLAFISGMLVIASLGSAARLWQINESLWLDELHTSWAVTETTSETGSKSIDGIAQRARFGNQSPFYFYLVGLSTQVLGHNELALRLPSLLAGIGLIAATGFLTWRWSGVIWAGWLASMLVALDHNMIFFSQEARPYAQVQLVALLQFAAFWRLQTTSSRGLRGVVVLGWILLFHLHYTAILLITGELLWWASMQWWQRGQGAYRPRQVLCDVCLAAVACGVTWTHLADIAARRAMWQMFIHQLPPWRALRWFHWDLYVGSALVLCIGVATIRFLWRRWRRNQADVSEVPAWTAVVPLLVLWWTSPVLITWSLTASDLARLYYPRYLIGVAVAPMMCAGLCLALCQGRRARTVAGLSVIIVALVGNGLLSQFLRDGRLLTDRRQDWRSAVEWLNAVRDDSRPVLVRSGLIEADRLRSETDNQLLRRYCLLPVTCIYRIRQPGELVPLTTSQTGLLSSQTIWLLEEHRGGWLVINMRPEMHDALRRELRESLGAHRLIFQQAKTFGNVAVWQVRLDTERRALY